MRAILMNCPVDYNEGNTTIGQLMMTQVTTVSSSQGYVGINKISVGGKKETNDD